MPLDNQLEPQLFLLLRRDFSLDTLEDATTADLKDLFNLNVRVITSDPSQHGVEPPCSTNDGCAGSCASACASRG
ncbi:FxLD family lanthipeptide [Fodinicola acaciae]|uniref:FxLD family lanthipeptide n=1 Tax=Fodinicola acaciae TaxID=2681555 RepID=UPI0013D3FDB1